MTTFVVESSLPGHRQRRPVFATALAGLDASRANLSSQNADQRGA